MIAAILREHFGETHALATEGNLNNDIGLPLTLLKLRRNHRAAVVELGVNHPGETATLAAIASPTVALINNAQREHQEFMKGVAEVAREHGAVFAAMKPGGTGVINADDEFSGYWRELLAGRRVRDFGLHKPTQVGGRHSVLNAFAAAACALAAGASLEAVARGLAAFRPVGGRMQRRTARSGGRLIDDSYNANPDSVRAAIDVLAAEGGAKVLLLGDMGEVGERGAEFHLEIGHYARERGIDRLLAVGELSSACVAAFGEGARHFATVEALISAAQAELRPRTTMLVKGSRVMRMERVVQALAGEPSSAGGH